MSFDLLLNLANKNKLCFFNFYNNTKCLFVCNYFYQEKNCIILNIILRNCNLNGRVRRNLYGVLIANAISKNFLKISNLEKIKIFYIYINIYKYRLYYIF